MSQLENERLGFHGFLQHLDDICEDSVGSPDLPPNEREQLLRGRELLRSVQVRLDKIAEASPNPDDTYQVFWELAAGAFLIGSRGVVSEGARLHTKANNARHANRTRIEKRNAGSGKDAIVDGIVAKYMNGPVKTVLPTVNAELSAIGFATIAASTLSRRRKLIFQPL